MFVETIFYYQNLRALGSQQLHNFALALLHTSCRSERSEPIPKKKKVSTLTLESIDWASLLSSRRLCNLRKERPKVTQRINQLNVRQGNLDITGGLRKLGRHLSKYKTINCKIEYSSWFFFLGCRRFCLSGGFAWRRICLNGAFAWQANSTLRQIHRLNKNCVSSWRSYLSTFISNISIF